jgi:hypothetical protein
MSIFLTKYFISVINEFLHTANALQTITYQQEKTNNFH